jgi:hypothetical protein
MNGDKPAALGALFEYLYRDNYGDQMQMPTFDDRLILHADVLMLADKYNLPTLAQLARTRIPTAIDEYLKKAPMDATFVSPVRIIFGATDDAFSKEVKDIVVQELCSKEAKMESSAQMADLIRSVPSLAAGVALHFLSRYATPTRSTKRRR